MKVITIGRSSENDVSLADMNVSRHHAQIVQADNGTYTITDLNSTNGTYVNGQRIYGSVALRENDFVKVGDSILPWKQYFFGFTQSRTRQAGQGDVANAYAQVYVQNVQNVGANYSPQPVEQGSNGFATAGFILSFFLPLLGFIFCIVGLSKANKMNGKGRGLAGWGLALSIIGMIVEIIVFVVYFGAVVAAFAV
jgi:hypothetical protein